MRRPTRSSSPTPSASSAAAPTRVALYTRVSTDLQAMADEGSLQTQEARLRAAVAARGAGHEVVAVFREEGASGKSLDRPALRKMLAAVEAGTLDLVMVTRLDRLSRSLLDFFELHKLFEQHEVQFYSLNESFDTSAAVGRAMLKLVLVFAELEREQTAERTKVAMAARAERGIWNGGHPILGYASDGAGHLSVVPEEAAVVRAAFDKMLELRSAREVAKWLHAQGHRQKRYSSRRRGDTGERPFSLSVVCHLLQDRRYLGEVQHNGQHYPGQHEAIIDAVTFDRVQEAMDLNRHGFRPPVITLEHHFLLAGKITCGDCGYALTTASAKNAAGVRYPYYRCVSVTKRPDLHCKVRLLAADKIEGAVLAVIRQAARRPELVQDAIAEAERIVKQELEPGRRRLDALRTDLAANQKETERLFNLLLGQGLTDLGHGKEKLRALDLRRQQLDAAIAEEEGKLAVSEERHLDFEAVTEAIRGFDAAWDHLEPGERREFVQEMIEAVVVHPDRVDVALYEGTKAVVHLEAAALRGRRAKAAPTNEAANDPGAVRTVPAAVRTEEEGARTGKRRGRPVKGTPSEFAWRVDWLPGRELNPRRGG